MAQASIRGVTIDHRIHIAGGNTKIEIGFAQCSKALCIAPVWLGNNAHSITLSLKYSANHRHTKARVIHIGIASD